MGRERGVTTIVWIFLVIVAVLLTYGLWAGFY